MPTKEGKLTPAEGRARARKYEKDKAKVKAFEARNSEYVVVFRSTGKGNWYKMGGLSATMWINVLGPRLNIQPHANPDTDFHSKFLDGIVSLRNIETFAENMKTLGAREVRLAKLCDKTGDIRVWRVKDLVDKADVDKIRQAKRAEREMLNKIVVPKTVLPEIHTRATEIMKILHSIIMEMEQRDAELVGVELGRSGMRLYGISFRMANDHLPKAEGLKKVAEEVGFLMRCLYLCVELRLCTVSRALRASSILSEIDTYVKKMQEAKELGL